MHGYVYVDGELTEKAVAKDYVRRKQEYLDIWHNLESYPNGIKIGSKYYSAYPPKSNRQSSIKLDHYKDEPLMRRLVTNIHGVGTTND